jgi:hypothetical protein
MKVTNKARKTGNHRICALALGAIVLLILSTACTGKGTTNETPLPNRAAEKFSFSVALNKSAYAQGEPITVTITTQVLDDGRASVGFENIDNPMHNYDLIVNNQYGQNVHLTELGMKLVLVRPGHMGWQLTKDAPWHDTFQVDDLFDLSEPGAYTLTLKQMVWTSLTISHELTTDPVAFTRLP